MFKPRLSVAQLAGVVVALLGTTLAVRWAFNVEVIASLIPGSRLIGIVTPALFLGCGVCLWSTHAVQAGVAVNAWLRRSSTACMGLLLLLPIGYLFEAATGIALGIDVPVRGAAGNPQNPFPGRLSPNAGVAFMLTGAAFVLGRKRLAGRRRAGFAVCTLAVAFIGLAGLVGHFLGLQTLYRIGNFNQILPPTAFGVTIVSAGLWALLGHGDRFELREAEGRITRRSLAVVALVATSCGVAGFAVMRDTFEQSISRNLFLTASTTATSLGHTIRVSLWFPRTVATRPAVAQAMAKLSAEPPDEADKDFLQRVANNILTAELTSAAFYDAHGVLQGKAGTSVSAASDVTHPLANAEQRASLAWSRGYVLLAENEVLFEGRSVGRLLTEQRLPLFDRLLSDVSTMNDTSDAAICSRDKDKAICAETRLTRAAFSVPMFDARGQPAFPVVRAVLGQRGVQIAKDPRGIQVVSAHVPIDDFGLGLAVKTDVDTLYAPLRSRLAMLGLSLVAIISLAIYALRRQVRPVLRRLVESERQIKAILEEQSELVSLATPQGRLTYVNPAYARHFGLRPDEMLGQNLFDHVAAEDRQAVEAVIESVMQSGQATTSMNRILGKDGAARWIAWTNSCQRGPQGQSLLHSVGRDITERRAAEVALRESQAMLARTGRVAGVGGWELDLHTHQVTWTEEIRRIHEVGAEYAPTLDGVLRFYTPEGRGAIEAAVRASASQGTPFDLELPLVTASGRAIWVRAQGQAECVDGAPVRLVGAVQDITERKKLERLLAENEQFMRQVTDSLPVRIAYLDRALRYRFVNIAHCKRYGLPREEILGRTRVELTGARAGDDVGDALEGVLNGKEQRFEFEEMVDGKVVRIESHLIPDFGDDGAVRGFYSTGLDVTERSAAERTQRRHAATLRSITEAIPAIVAVVGPDGRYRFVNSGFERWINRDRGAIVGLSMQEVLGEAEYRRSEPFVRRALGGETVKFEKQYIDRDEARHLAITHIPLWLESGRIDGFVAVAQDITEHRQEEGRLLQLTQLDALTGLLNRAGFEQYVSDKLRRSEVARSLALLYIDLDHFKPVNDNHGHLVGDELLKQFAQRLKRTVRPTDAVARLGGDEFAIVMVEVRDSASAQAVANKVISAARVPFRVGAVTLHIGASVGVAFGVDPSGAWQDLVARADANLYRAKSMGRGRVASPR